MTSDKQCQQNFGKCKIEGLLEKKFRLQLSSLCSMPGEYGRKLESGLVCAAESRSGSVRNWRKGREVDGL